MRQLELASYRPILSASKFGMVRSRHWALSSKIRIRGGQDEVKNSLNLQEVSCTC